VLGTRSDNWREIAIVLMAPVQGIGTVPAERLTPGAEPEVPNLGFAQAENQGDDAAGEKNDAGRGRQPIAVFGPDSDSGVAELHAVMLMVRDRDHKRQQSQYQ
jgi:hypothetical protein